MIRRFVEIFWLLLLAAAVAIAIADVTWWMLVPAAIVAQLAAALIAYRQELRDHPEDYYLGPDIERITPVERLSTDDLDDDTPRLED